jgi:ATP-dependent HslUV protease subunit HslV
VADREHGFVISGDGELIEPDDGVIAIGSGGRLRAGAARRLSQHTALPPREVVRRGLEIAGEICIYSNTNITVLEPVEPGR